MTVVVTGATGFLGRVVVDELARRGTEVVAVVRAGDDAEAGARLHGALTGAGLGPAGRARARAGDIEVEGFGLDPASLGEVGVIVHCAAAVNGALPADALRSANVGGARHAVRLAKAVGARVVHVSTTAVLGGAGEGHRHEGSPPAPGPDPTGYAATKAAAEEAVRAEAESTGVEAVVVRVGAVGGHTGTGFMNDRDFRWLVARACAALGVHPITDTAFRWAPVDFVAAVLAEAAAAPGDAPATLHVLGPELRWLTLFSWLRRLGHPMRMVDRAGWEGRLRAAAVDPGADEAVTRLSVLSEIIPSGQGPSPDDQASRAWLAQRGLVCPEADHALVGAMADRARARGEWPPPSPPAHALLAREMLAALRAGG